MPADFESAIEELKIAFSDFKEVLIVILYGSVARGDFSRRHSDLDLFVILNKKTINGKLKERIEDKITLICLKHKVRLHLEFQSKTIRHEDQTLIQKMIEEGKIIYSSGTLMIGNDIIGLKRFVIYEYSLKDSKKGTLFSKALHGRKSWYYKGKKKIVKEYSGIIDRENIIYLGKGAIMVKQENIKDMTNLFERMGVEYKVKKIVYG